MGSVAVFPAAAVTFPKDAASLRRQIEGALARSFPAALSVPCRPAPQMLATGVAEVDTLIGGLERGALTEIVGASSSGRSSLLLSTLAQATRHQEVCALVDAGDTFDPASAQASGIELERLLWVRCGRAGKEYSPKKWQRLEQALKATDLILQSAGFGVVAIDLGDISPTLARRVPLTSWFRFRRAVEGTPTVLLVVEQEAFAKTCASLVLETRRQKPVFAGQNSSHQPAPGCLLESCSVQVHARRKNVSKAAVNVHYSAPYALAR